MKFLQTEGVLRTIEPTYQAPGDARGYRYFVVEGYHIFAARNIKILDPMTLSTEGIWRFKQLFLDGADTAVSFWLFEES